MTQPRSDIRRQMLTAPARIVIAATSVITIAAGCNGYTWIKKSEIEKRTRIVVDSSHVVELREQLAALQERCSVDSAKYANTKFVTMGVPDSVLKARDAELAAVKEQLAKATAELDRIKRRLSTPRN